MKKNAVATEEIFHLLILATWINNSEDYDLVVEVLVGKGMIDISQHEYFNRAYWRKCIRRSTPQPEIHAFNIRAILNQLISDKKFAQVMTKEVKEWFERFSVTAEKEYYQLTDDFFHYTCVGTDRDGLSLYCSELGTNMNENLHQKYADLVGPFAVGVRVAHVLTALRSYRYNISVDISMGGEPNFGIDNQQAVDECQVWMFKIFGVFAWPTHKNLIDFDGKKFISVGIGPLPHDTELVTMGNPKEGLSEDYNYMCPNMGVVLAPLPVSTSHEQKLFNQEMKKYFKQTTCQHHITMDTWQSYFWKIQMEKLYFQILYPC